MYIYVCIHMYTHDVFGYSEYNHRDKYSCSIHKYVRINRTENRMDKVKYFKELDLWYLPELDTCTNGKNMHDQVNTYIYVYMVNVIIYELFII
jgi:hypothetical protein